MAPLVRTGFAALALAALPLVGGCGEAEDKQSAPVTQDDATRTLAAALGANKALGTFQSAIEQSELSGVLDGRASYTVLAPKDRAFAALGEDGAALLEDEEELTEEKLAHVQRTHLDATYQPFEPEHAPAKQMQRKTHACKETYDGNAGG